ncbi:MAG TPA: 7-cyano-7-deazaguanine synthase QueC [Myxococcota bacterium]|nr:7-cyano-7-deazaguanine synthase QueC [Myxococcota bacterium]
MKSAVVLLSGGLDSTTTLAIAKDMGYRAYALTILYGQRNHIEALSAKKVAALLSIEEHKIIELNLRLFGGSSLTDDISVGAHVESRVNEIPNTYVPARNTILLSLALAYAEVSKADDIFFGANIHDYSGYPDCRPSYIHAFEKMANLAVKSATLGHHIRIHAPLVNLSKAEIIKKGCALGVPYEHTHSCYDPRDNLACGSCSSCFYRRKGFIDAGITDPTNYAPCRPAA